YVGEVVNWERTPEAAVDRWLWSVYHRSPFMNPRFLQEGYGVAEGGAGGRGYHHVMDFGAKAGEVTRTDIWGFPVPGQVDVPVQFEGWLEVPTPPSPAGGSWKEADGPSGQVVSIHFPTVGWSIAEHHIYKHTADACQELEHTLISKDNDPNLM